MTLANKITLARLALIPLCVVLLLAGLYGLAATLFLLLSLSDYLDGYVARKYNQVSDLGKKLDPLADKVLVLSMLIGLTGLGKADPAAVILIGARELLVASFRGYKNFPASPLAKWKTVAQLAAIVLLLFNLPLAGPVLWFAVLLSLVTGGTYLWQIKILDQLRSN